MNFVLCFFSLLVSSWIGVLNLWATAFNDLLKQIIIIIIIIIVIIIIIIIIFTINDYKVRSLAFM